MVLSLPNLAISRLTNQNRLVVRDGGEHRVGETRSSDRSRVVVKAFTLVELLVVMGIIALLLGITVLGFKNMLGGHGVEGAINNVTGVLEMSRTTAISNRTYVWTLFKNTVTSDNNWELKCVGVVSQNGLNAYNAANVRPITKVIRVTGVKNVKYSLMPTNVQAITPSDFQTDGAFIAGYYSSETASGFGSGSPVMIDGENFQGATFMGFLPDGEVGTSGAQDPYRLMVEPRVALGLIPTRGPTIQTSGKDGAIIAVYGGSGKIRVIRP